LGYIHGPGFSQGLFGAPKRVFPFFKTVGVLHREHKEQNIIRDGKVLYLPTWLKSSPFARKYHRCVCANFSAAFWCPRGRVNFHRCSKNYRGKRGP